MSRTMWLFVLASMLCAAMMLSVVVTASWSSGQALSHRRRALVARDQMRMVSEIFVEAGRLESEHEGFVLASLARPGSQGPLALFVPTPARPGPAPNWEQAQARLAPLFVSLHETADLPLSAGSFEGAVWRDLGQLAGMSVRAGRGEIEEAFAEMRARAASNVPRDVDMRYAKLERELHSRDIVETGLVAAQLRQTRVLTLVGGGLCCVLLLVLNLSMAKVSSSSENTRRLALRRASEVAQAAEALRQRDEVLRMHVEAQGELVSRLAYANQELRCSNRDLDQFAYITSHDLKAPLRGISHLAAWIEEDLGEAGSKVKAHLDLLHGRVARLELLIDGILDYSRAGRGRLRPPEQIDLAMLTEEAVSLVAPPPSVKVNIVKPLPIVSTYRVPLEQVLLNLLGNAVKHGCPSGGEITVSASEEASGIRICVKDNGPGIEPQYHARIFGIFQRLVARDHIEGAGVGLAVVKRLVERAGGTISLLSQKGAGAEFQVQWPKAV